MRRVRCSGGISNNTTQGQHNEHTTRRRAGVPVPTFARPECNRDLNTRLLRGGSSGGAYRARRLSSGNNDKRGNRAEKFQDGRCHAGRTGKEIAMIKRLISYIVIVAPIALVLYVTCCWVVNIFKLFECDFSAPWKGEIIHALGIIPILAPFTVWFDDK